MLTAAAPMLRLGICTTSANQSMPLHLAPEVTVGAIAAHLSGLETGVNAATLEQYRPLAPHSRLRDHDLATGDRLLIELGAVRGVALPSPSQTGDTRLRFIGTQSQLSSIGKAGLLLGVGDDSGENAPDVDVRPFIQPAATDMIGRGCAWLSYEAATHSWFIAKIGRTRLFLDEYELGNAKMPLVNAATLRFFPAPDAFLPQNRLLGEVRIVVETTATGAQLPALTPGSSQLQVQLGVERTLDALECSPSLEVHAVSDALLRHYGLAPLASTRLVALRILSPEARISALGVNTVLYMPRAATYVQSVLRLTDHLRREVTWEFVASEADAERFIGCRPAPEITDPRLDLDVYPLIAREQVVPAQIALGIIWAHLRYVSAENTWWIIQGERALPIFINQQRLGTQPIRLNHEDMLQLGVEASDVVLRLIIGITRQY